MPSTPTVSPGLEFRGFSGLQSVEGLMLGCSGLGFRGSRTHHDVSMFAVTIAAATISWLSSLILKS